ncbi:hypothetical protein EON68_02670, partial [archaeon]
MSARSPALCAEPAGSVSWMGSHRPGDAGGVASTLVSPLASLASTSGRMSAGGSGSGSGAAASSMHHANMHHALTPASNLYGNQYGAASTSAGTPLSTAAAAAGCVAATSGVTDMAWEPCMVPGGSSSVAAGGSFDADANGSARGSVLPRLHTAMAAVGGMPMMAAANQHAAATGFYPTSMPMLGGAVRQVALVVSVPEPTMPQRMFADSEGVEAWMLHYAEAYAENFASAYAYSIMEGYADALRNYASSAAFPAYGWAGAPAMPHPAPGAWTTAAAATAPTGTTGCGGAGDWSGGYACSTT